MDRLAVNQDILADAASRLLVVADKVNTARGVLEHGLSGIGPCWGTTDDVAAQFAGDYLPGRDDVLDSSRDLAGVLRQLGERTSTAARTFSGVD